MDASVFQRLKSLSELQKIHSRLDRIRHVRGGLPEEVHDLEDELEGLKTRLLKQESDIAELNREIEFRNMTIGDSRAAIEKYSHQIMNIKNNREYEALNKEIELAQLEIQTCERKIRHFNDQIQNHELKIQDIAKIYQEREADLNAKREELETLIQETQHEEDSLIQDALISEGTIEPRLLRAYTRIRKSMRNGLAVVTTDRGACGGCFAIIPPQRLYEIRQKRKIIVCENCGRILVDEGYFTPPGEQTQQTVAEAQPHEGFSLAEMLEFS